MARCRLRRILGGEAWGRGGDGRLGDSFVDLGNTGNAWEVLDKRLLAGVYWPLFFRHALLLTNVMATSVGRHRTLVFSLAQTISRRVCFHQQQP